IVILENLCLGCKNPSQYCFRLATITGLAQNVTLEKSVILFGDSRVAGVPAISWTPLRQPISTYFRDFLQMARRQPAKLGEATLSALTLTIAVCKYAVRLNISEL